jgi:hypothetical protein
LGKATYHKDKPENNGFLKKEIWRAKLMKRIPKPNIISRKI